MKTKEIINGYKYGILETLFFIPLFWLYPKASLVALIVLTAVINSYTDIKERYVDDQFVLPPIIFGIVYAYMVHSLTPFLWLFTLTLVFSVVLYVIGAWSSGDITAMMSITPVFLLTGLTTEAFKVYLIIFSLIFMVVFLSLAIKRGGLDVIKPDFKRLILYSIPSPFYVVFLFYAAKIHPLISIIVFPIPFVSRKAYYTLSALGFGLLLYYRTFPLERLGIVFIAAIISVYIFMIAGKVRAAYVKKVPVKMIKEGDVIHEMVVGDPPTLVPASLKNIVQVKQSNYKIILKPSAEGLKKEEVEYLKKTLPNAEVTLKDTVFIAPFIYLSAIILLVYYLI